MNENISLPKVQEFKNFRNEFNFLLHAEENVTL